MHPRDVQSLVEAIPLVTAVEHHATIGSTNARALEAVARGAPEGLVVIADAQQAGRGRRGRVWHAPPGTALLVSVLLRPTLPMTMWPLLPLMAGTAVHLALHRAAPAAAVGLKWPNDVLIAGAKAAGVLVESTGDGVVVGIGLNLDWRGVARPVGVVATSLAEACGGGVDRLEVLRALLVALDAGYASSQSDPAGVIPAYVPRCVTLGRTVVAHGVPDGQGIAVGLTSEGHLRIRRASGDEITVSAGEVEHLR